MVKPKLDFYYGLLILFFAATLSSQTAMDVFAGMMMLCCLLDLFREPKFFKKKWLELRVGNEKWFLAFTLAIVLSFAFSQTASVSDLLYRLAELRWYFFVITLIWFFKKRDIGQLKTCVALLGLASAWAIVIWIIKYDPLHPSSDLSPWQGGIRTGGLLGNAMTFGHVYGIYFCFFVGWFTHLILAKKAKSWELICMLLLAGALLLSFTRGVWLAAALAIAVFGFFFRIPRARSATVMAVALALMVCLFVEPVRHRIVETLSMKDERTFIWQGHLEIFKDHPVLGVGYGENSKILPEYYHRLGVPSDILVSHAHNQYLHMAAGLGVIGLLAYLGLMLSFFRMTFTQTGPRALRWGVFTAQLFFLFGGLAESNFEHSKVKYVMCFIWAISARLESGEGLGYKQKEEIFG